LGSDFSMCDLWGSRGELLEIRSPNVMPLDFKVTDDRVFSFPQNPVICLSV